MVLLLSLAMIIGLGTYAAAKLKRPYLDDAPIQQVLIPKGSSSREIAQILEQKKIIRGDRIFLYYLVMKRAAGKVQAGNYELSAGMTIPEIVEKLTLGQVLSNEARLRIGEGWNLAQIGKALEENGLGKKESFYKLAGSPPWEGSQLADSSLLLKFSFSKNLPRGATLEGYLFPDTYLISREGGAEELAFKMLRNFDARVDEDLRNGALKLNKTLHQVLTVASLVEAEVGRNVSGRSLTDTEKEELETERKIVAGIFWKRLSIGMALESDATISYITGKPKRQSALDDLQIKSPYNTYRNPGLPPGPIGNPGLAAIKAALDPAATSYLYFVSAPDGKAYFARTLEEHKRNRAQYLNN